MMELPGLWKSGSAVKEIVTCLSCPVRARPANWTDYYHARNSDRVGRQRHFAAQDERSGHQLVADWASVGD
eukprot:6193956-Pleurochrysis_carterae.AAC.1